LPHPAWASGEDDFSRLATGRFEHTQVSKRRSAVRETVLIKNRRLACDPDFAALNPGYGEVFSPTGRSQLP
jgi:hypothetical protein